MEENHNGKLYLVPTPIGNLKDITLRALEVLENSDLIAAEDTRQSLKLLNHFGIKKTLTSYHKYNEQSKSELLIEKLKEGNVISLVSDAGTPGISDPGCILVSRCIEENIDFEVLPGATAITTALVYSGLDTTKFLFRGFLPRKLSDRKAVIEEVKDQKETLIFYEAPHRLKETLKFLKDNLGNRKIVLCRELTKVYEEILRFNIDDSLKYYDENTPKGEFVIIVEGKSVEDMEREKKAQWEDISIEEHIIKYMNEGVNKRNAIKKVAKDRNMSKSEVYKHSYDI